MGGTKREKGVIVTTKIQLLGVPEVELLVGKLCERVYVENDKIILSCPVYFTPKRYASVQVLLKLPL